MYTRARRGFTLIEVTITAALAATLAVLVFTAFVSIMRVVAIDQSLLTMDRSADNALNRIADNLRTAILPITYANASTPLQTALNDRTTGFRRYGRLWRDILQEGSDCLAFTTPADFGDDRDFVDADMLLELGIVLPSGVHVPVGQYDNPVDNHLLPGGSLHPFLARLDPRQDLGLTRGLGELDLSAPRFDRTFTFNNDMDAGYCIIRFVPFFENDAPYVLRERTLGRDINEDDDTTDEFALGGLEFVYPNVVRDEETMTYSREGEPIVIPITGPNVLLQLNQDDPQFVPIFKLVSYRDRQNSANLETFDESLRDGDYAILVRLLLCDQQTQSANPLVFNLNVPPIVTRQYETVVKLRNIVTR